MADLETKIYTWTKRVSEEVNRIKDKYSDEAFEEYKNKYGLERKICDRPVDKTDSTANS